jgi:uncharacterized alkaline shock family protein YloU
MSKELERENLDLQEDDSLGSVKIADDVVAMIAALAASEVEGVASMAGDLTHELMNKIGYNSLTRGVKVEVYAKKVKVDISLNMEYGYNIPATCQKVQGKVQNMIENMTGLQVTDVNIRIAGVHVK